MKKQNPKCFLGLKDVDNELMVTLGDLVDRLSIINLKIWHLENDIRNGGEGKFTLDEIGRRSLIIRDLNKERVAYKNALNKIEEKYYNDIKIDHRSAHQENNNNEDTHKK